MAYSQRRVVACLAFAICLASVCVGTTAGIAIAQENTGAKLRFPAPDRQAEIRKLLDETYGLSKATTLTKKKQLAETLMGLVSIPETEQDERYVVLVTVLPLLREMGDFPTYSGAVKQLVATYEVDADAVRLKYLTEFMTECKSPSKLEPVAMDAVATAGLLAHENKYRQAKQIVDAADAQSKKLSVTKLGKSLAELRVLLAEHERSFTAKEQAQKTLLSMPDDPMSNFALGVWLAVFEDRWGEAVQNLARCHEAKWKAAAVADTKASSDSESQQVAGDAWWDVAQAASGQIRLGALLRSQHWYRLYEPNAKSPLAKARLQKRLDEIAAATKFDDSLVVGFLGQSIPGTVIAAKSSFGSSSASSGAKHQDHGSLTILGARYGARDRWTDMTERITKGVQSGRLIMLVNIDLVRHDPAFGAAKRLELRYRLDGNDYEHWYADDALVQLDTNDDEPPGPARKLIIMDALYGTGILGESKWADVTDRVKAKVQGDRLSLPVKALVEGVDIDRKDATKSLYIRYFNEGEIQTSSFLKDDTVQLGSLPTKKSSSGPKRRPSDDSGLTILAAAYGAKDTWVDLTEQAAAAAKGGRLLVAVTQTSLTGDDPVPNVQKRFRLRYRLGGKLFEESWAENGVAYLESRKTSASDKSGNLEILEARCGIGIMSDKTWQDVTNQVRSKVVGNKISLPMGELLKSVAAKPEKGNRGLFVRYSLAGELRAVYVENQGTLTIGQ